MSGTSNTLAAMSTGVDADAYILDHAPLYETIFYYYMGYLLSPFAMICFLTILISNRVIVMSSVRDKYGNQGKHSSLPLWSNILLHGGITVLLGLCFIQSLHEMNVTDVFFKIFIENDDPSFLYMRLLAVVACSHIIEAFMSSTLDIKPLYDFDYSLFEMALQYYLYMVSLKHRAPLSPRIENLTQNQMLLDSLVIITNNIVIHSLELLNLRKFRLILSIITNVVHFYYTKDNFMVIIGTNRLYVTYLRLFFKFLPIVVILLNITYMVFDWFIHKCFSKDVSTQLQFFKELKYFYRLNSDQEMTRTVMILARRMLEKNSSSLKLNHVALDSATESLETGFDRNGISNDNVFISGYLNKLQTSPEDTVAQETKISHGNNNNQNKEDNDNYKLNIPSCFTKLKWSADLFLLSLEAILQISRQIVMVSLNFLKIRKSPVADDDDDEKHKKSVHSHDHHFKDLNRLVTSHNYYKFLTRYTLSPDGNQQIEQFDIHKYLLPNDDTSPDYCLPNDTDEHNKALKAQDKMAFIPTDTDGMKVELVQLFSDFNSNMMESTDNLNWYNSMYSILKYELENDKERVTRAQYGASNDETILNEVVLERWTANEDLREQVNGSNSNVFDYDDDDDDDNTDEGLDLLCVICLQEVRNIAFWPCRCLSICNDCRKTLGSRGFSTCVSCKSEVEGYTKLNIV